MVDTSCERGEFFLDKEKRHKDDCTILQHCLGELFVLHHLEHHSSGSRKAENICVRKTVGRARLSCA
jgi:hypothetical protein